MFNGRMTREQARNACAVSGTPIDDRIPGYRAPMDGSCANLVDAAEILIESLAMEPE
jgi:hypothetical protein